MKNNLILGLILTSVLLMSVIGISAQEITGESVRITGYVNCGNSAPGTVVSGSICNGRNGMWEKIQTIDPADSSSTGTETRTSVSAGSARSSSVRASQAPKGFIAVTAADPKVGTCYVQKSAGRAGRSRLFGLVISN